MLSHVGEKKTTNKEDQKEENYKQGRASYFSLKKTMCLAHDRPTFYCMHTPPPHTFSPYLQQVMMLSSNVLRFDYAPFVISEYLIVVDRRQR